MQNGLAVCPICHSITDQVEAPCPVCGKATHYRKPASLQKVWAWWIAGLIAYIPGNLYPIMITSTVGSNEPSTILGGVKVLIHHGSHAIAFVIFFFSIVVPLVKFVIIAWLAIGIQQQRHGNEHTRHRGHEIVEFVGRWSMVDVFVVAALAALIQIGGIMAIYPGLGINAFAASVVCTMLSAMSFDARLIWDQGPASGHATGSTGPTESNGPTQPTGPAESAEYRTPDRTGEHPHFGNA